MLLFHPKGAFVHSVLNGLPSLQFETDYGRISDERMQNNYREELAELAITYVQMEEALGRPPQLKEIGERFSYRSKVLNTDEFEAWRIYCNAIESAKPGKQ